MLSIADVFPIQALEDRVKAKVQLKFDRRIARANAAESHRSEVLSWIKIADLAEYRRFIRAQRRDFILDCTSTGLASEEEATQLAVLKHPFKRGLDPETGE